MERSLYPLTFEPLLKELVWGGRKLAALGKPLPDERPIGESWEVVDLPDDQSVVADGPLEGATLHQLVESHRSELLGPVALDGGRFPLLVKYIDAAQTLSVQVHPDEAAAARMGRGRPKNEAWYILDAEPDGVLYLGLKPGTTRQQLEASIADGSIEELLVRVQARPGMLAPVTPGTVHAIGAGVLLAEVQQPSDTTYRVYDWGRVGLDGKPRQLHIAEALECTRLDAAVDVDGDQLDAGHFRGAISTVSGAGIEVGDAGPRVVIGLTGAAVLESAGHAPQAVERGTVVLVPHCVSSAKLAAAEGEATAMVVSFPC